MAESSREPRSWRPLRRAALVLLGLLTIGAPLAIGGVLPQVFVSAALAGGVALLLTLVGRRDRVPMPAVAWVLLGGGLMALVCTLPLPTSLVSHLSPRAFALSSLPGDPRPASVALSLDVPATLMAVARLWGLLAILLAAACLAVRPEQARWLARLVAFSGVAVAAVAVGHFALGINDLYGLIPHKFEGRTFTVFLNANHAASLGILSTLACLGLSVGRVDVLDRWAWWVGAVICGLLALSTQSIAGLSTLAFGIGAFVVLQLRRKLGLTGTAALIQPLVVGAAVIGVLLLLLGVGVLVTDSVDWVQIKAQNKILPWTTVLHLVRESWLTGVGAGAFGQAFEAFMPPGHMTTITHPENFVLQWMAEWGVPAAILAMLAFVGTFWTAFRVPAHAEDRLGGIHDALLAATVAVLLHELADFGLEFDGVGIPFVVALGVLVARGGRPSGRRWTSALIGVAAVASAVLAVRVAMPRLLDVQVEEAKLQVFGVRKTEVIASAFEKVMRLHPANSMVPVLAAHTLALRSTAPGTKAAKRQALDLALKYLDRADELSQLEGAYLNRAWVLGALGRRPEALEQLREAFRRGRDWEGVVKLGNSLGATPAELAAMPAALRDIAISPSEKLDLVSVATERLIRDGASNASQRRALAAAVLGEVDKGHIPASPAVLEATCRSLANDAACSRTVTFGCDLPQDADRISAQALSVGTAWIQREPYEAKAYQCAAYAYWSFDATEERARVLATGIARLPDDLLLRALFGAALVDEGQPAAALEAVSNIVPENVTPDIAEIVYTARARALWHLGKHAKALRLVDDAVRLNPESFWAYSLAIRSHQIARQFDQALSLLDEGRRFSRGREAYLQDWRATLLAERARDAANPNNVEAKALSMDQSAPNPGSGTSSSSTRYTRGGRTRFLDVDVQLMRLH